MRMHKLPIVFAALLAAPAASAQVGNAPFCLATDSEFGGEPDCTYRTWAQCRLSQRGGHHELIRQGELPPASHPFYGRAGLPF
jgi:hypothetical protein